MPESPIPAPSNVRQIFWGWDRPILELAIQQLTAGWNGELLDLSHLAIIVSTGNAARILKEALALKAAEKNAAVLSPTILTPDALLSWADPSQEVPASVAHTLLAWAGVLQTIDLDDFRAVFPRDPVSREFNWALQTAQTFRKLQQTIGEAGWSISQAAERLGPDFTEALRWEQLSELEKRYNSALAEIGKRDRNQVRSSVARNSRPAAGIEKLMVLSVPDPMPLAKFCLQQLAATGFPIDICIHAPERHHLGFDAWGTTVADYWKELPVAIPQPEKTIRILPRPQSQAAEIVRICAASKNPAAEFALGVVDPEIVSLAAAQLEDAGIAVFDPEGVPFLQHGMHWLLTVWAELLEARNWSAFSQLIRIPHFIQALATELPEEEKYHPNQLLILSDEIQQLHLPSSLDTLQKTLRNSARREKDEPLVRAIDTTLHWAATFEKLDFDQALTRFLETIYGSNPPSNGPAAAAFNQAAAQVLDTLMSVSEATRLLEESISPAEQMQLLLRLLKDAQLFPEASESNSLELSGWLELPWQPAPSLIIAGMNEGLIPPSITSDPWVPHGIRGQLNLTTNDDRFAAHACRLAALIESRREADGQLHFLAGRTTGSADPLKPSRLLMLCPRAELPARISQLFQESEPEDAITPPWSRAWQLKPVVPDWWKFTKLSATGFGKYLHCPFRFFLENIMKMRDVDAAKQEMDYLDFGNLCHHAFEALAKDPEMMSSVDPAAISSFLHQQVADHMFHLYGKPLSIPLMIQQSAAQQRLHAAAKILANNRQEGWVIKYVETNIREIIGEPWLLDGIEITGKIDMVEQHRDSGAWRIIDYKTSGKPKSPEEAHLVKGKPGEHQLHIPNVVTEDGRVWANLQLPIYAAALEKFFGQQVSAAYLNLPPASSQTSLIEWPGMSNHLEEAVACAAGIIHCIKTRQFWPANEKIKADYDSCARLFVNGPEESIDPSLLAVQ